MKPPLFFSSHINIFIMPLDQKKLEERFFEVLKFKGVPTPVNDTIFYFSTLLSTDHYAPESGDVHERIPPVMDYVQSRNAEGKFEQTADGKPLMVRGKNYADAAYTDKVKSIPEHRRVKGKMQDNPRVYVPLSYDLEFVNPHETYELRIGARPKVSSIMGNGVTSWEVTTFECIGQPGSATVSYVWGQDKLKIMALVFSPECADSPYYWSPREKERSGIDIGYPGGWTIKEPSASFKCDNLVNVSYLKKSNSLALDQIFMSEVLMELRSMPSGLSAIASRLNITLPMNIHPESVDNFYWVQINSRLYDPNKAQSVAEALAADMGSIYRDSLAQELIDRKIVGFIGGKWVFLFGSNTRPVPGVGESPESLVELIRESDAFASNMSMVLKRHAEIMERNSPVTAIAERAASGVGDDIPDNAPVTDPYTQIKIAVGDAIAKGFEWKKKGKPIEAIEKGCIVDHNGSWVCIKKLVSENDYGFQMLKAIPVEARTAEERRRVLEDFFIKKIKHGNKSVPEIVQVIKDKINGNA